MSSRQPPALTATVWGGVAMLVAVAAVVVVALPSYPDEPQGFQDLAWFLRTALAGVLVAVVAAALAVHRGLARAGHPHPVATAVVVLPVAVALGAVGTLLVGIALAPLLLLAAPAVSAWLVGLAAARSGAARGQ